MTPSLAMNFGTVAGRTLAPIRFTPGPDWNGTAGSGFTVARPIPTDPTRTTAKPAARLLTPANQHFTSSIDVGVIAAANNNGTLGADLGIKQVTFHYEGNTLVVTTPRWFPLETERGTRLYFGWWVNLKKIIGLIGKARLYVEVEAEDATMQKRVLGPFNFSPQDSVYDLELEIAPSLPEIVGQRYQSFWPAISYARTQLPHNPRFLITELGPNDGKYEIERNPVNNAEAPTDQYDITGRYTVESTVPVSIGRLGYTTDALALIPGHRTYWRLKGSNITYDTRYVRNWSARAVTTFPGDIQHWLDGVDITTSDPDGRNELFRGGTTPRAAQIVAGRPIFTECHFTQQNTPCPGSGLVRGCLLEDSSQDQASNARCIVQSVFAGGNQDFWNSDALAFTVEYAGVETVATLSRSGGNYSSGATGGIWRLLLGATTYSFDTGNGGEDYFLLAPDGGYNGESGVGGYWASDVVDWLNTLPDITATLSPDFAAKDRVAAACSRPGLKGQGFGTGAGNASLGAADLKAGPVEIVWTVDTHGDWYQHTSGIIENAVIAFNSVYDVEAQMVFLSPILSGGVAASRDMAFIGNSFCADAVAKLYYDPNTIASQFSRSQPMSHVILAHNSFANQRLILNTVTGNITDGGYNLIKNNAFRAVTWTAQPLEGFVIDGLLIHEGQSVPQNATNFRVAGSAETLFVNPFAGDFTPTALLREQGFVPAIGADVNGTTFPDPCAPGAIAALADELLVIPPAPDPTDSLSALGLTLAGLLGTDVGSGMFDLRTATNNGLYLAQNLGGGSGDLAQGTATLQPTISATTGGGFDGSTRLDSFTTDGSAPFDVYLLMRKDVADDFGHLINGTITYQAGSAVGSGGVSVDGVASATRGATHDALDDGDWHTVKIENLTPASGQTTIVPIGRTVDSLVGDVVLIVIIRRAGFPSTLADVNAAALAWIDEQKALLP